MATRPDLTEAGGLLMRYTRTQGENERTYACCVLCVECHVDYGLQLCRQSLSSGVLAAAFRDEPVAKAVLRLLLAVAVSMLVTAVHTTASVNAAACVLCLNRDCCLRRVTTGCPKVLLLFLRSCL